MDHSWRPPPVPGNICPICSISHFPFCPLPPNPRFQPTQNNYFSQQPHYNHPPLPNHQFPLNYNNPPNNSYDSMKRMKFDNNNNNERILKLIHDHGNAAKVDLVSGEGVNRYAHETGLKRRREISDDRLVYDQRYELGQSRFDQVDGFLPDSSYYSLSGQNQFPPSVDHHLQTNHSFLSSHVASDVNVNNWSESKAHYGPDSFGMDFHHHGYRAQPPLPASPPPPLPLPIRNNFFEVPVEKPSLFPVAGSSSADSSSARSAVLENQSSAQVYYTNNAGHHASTLSSTEEFHTRQSSSERHVRDAQQFPLRHLPLEKPTIIDASRIFKHPHRASRPDHLVIILRGLPGSGKSYLAKVLRDIEVENGGEAPRIHSMDEYFMTEVEKAEDSELSKSSGSLRGKRQVMKKVMEYCYEPEMEEAYRASMLKAFKKTLDEGVFSFIIVDDRNLRVADFAQFWATAKRSGYEVYIVEAAYKDPAGCAARNVHNFTLDDIQKMARQWEEAPSLYMKMNIKSLLHGDGVDESGIQEVDMDMEDEDAIDSSHGTDVQSPQDEIKNQVDDFTPHDASPVKDMKHPVTNHHKVNHLSKSKWSNDLDGSESVEAEGGKKKASALSGLIHAYNKEGKSVQWGDQGGNVGFSIGATRKTTSLVIGPGSGYNLKSNPLSEEEYLKPAKNAVESKRQNVFQEQIRAERESFKAVFDKRRQRIGGFNIDEE